jgi:tripartite-type tricarboxylate transporter receptor subunit TctC
MRRLAPLLLLVLLASGPARAGWPERPVRLVVPFAPGGTTDIIARHYLDFLRTRLGQLVVVENRPGASTNIGAELVARAEPDGTTLLLGAGLLISNPIWGPKPSFDPATAFAPVSMVADTQFLLAAGPRFKAEAPAGLVAAARTAPGRISVSSAQLDLTVARLSQALGIQLQHVGYRGGAPAMTDAIAGQVDMVVALVPVLLPAVREGQLRPIGVTGPRRSPVLPEVPSLVEAGYPAANEMSWNAVFAPAGTPAEAIDRLAAETRAFASDPALGQRLREQGIEPRASTPAELADFLARERLAQQALFRELGPLSRER